MKSNKLATFTAATCLLCAPLGAANLIINPGNDLALVGGEIAGWTEESGTTWTQRDENPSAQAGTHYFQAGNNGLSSSDPDWSGELAQTIDVTSYGSSIDLGTQQFDFTGFVSGYSKDASSNSDTDTAQIIVEYRGAGGSSLLGSYDSGAATYNYHNDDWVELTDSRFAPVGTREITVRLITVRKDGTNNDGYFDSLSLTTTAVPEPSSTALLGLGLCSLLLRRKRS